MKVTVKNDLSKKYSRPAIFIHWISTLLILILFPLGKYMSGLEPSEKMDLVQAHAILGNLVFLLTIYRTWLIFKSPRPADLKTGSKFNDKLSVWIHNAFYFLIFGIAISGLATMILGGYADAISTGDVALVLEPSAIPPLKGHELMVTILMLLLLAHVGGVIKHYALTKENTLKRMW
jgi:cytochrome b561